MVSSKQLERLRNLFREDGIEISDEALLETGLWLLGRAKAICVPIPSDKEPIYQEIVDEMRTLRGLPKTETVRDNPRNQCKETSNN
jgi:hypothetical protein